MTLPPVIYNRAKNWVDNIRSSFWAIPCLAIILAILLALINVWVDTHVINAESLGWSWSSGMEGMRGALSTTAAAILGAAGVSFSITIASLTLASQQFGPRLIRNFMRDRFIQTVLGFFAATFVYCMLTMLLSDIFATDNYVPASTLAVTLTLIIVDLVLLTLFLHHICVSIQVDKIIADVFEALLEQLEFHCENGNTAPCDDQQAVRLIEALRQTPDHSSSRHDGYLRYIDYDGLLSFAEANNLLMHVQVRAGDYILKGQVLCQYCRDAGQSTIELNNEKFFIIDKARTELQDLEYSIRQLVEIALRALSPGINDPFTAMTCIDRLGSALNHIAHSNLPGKLLYDSSNAPRLIRKCSEFSALVELAFNQIRQNAANHADVTIKLLETITSLAKLVPDPQQCQPLSMQTSMIMQKLHDSTPAPMDYDAVVRRYEAYIEAVAARESASDLQHN
jgi:uncharacterized membrane protein